MNRTIITWTEIKEGCKMPDKVENKCSETVMVRYEGGKEVFGFYCYHDNTWIDIEDRKDLNKVTHWGSASWF